MLGGVLIGFGGLRDRFGAFGFARRLLYGFSSRLAGFFFLYVVFFLKRGQSCRSLFYLRYNIFFTLGATALIMPIPLDLALNTAVITNVAVTALLVAFVTLSKKQILGRLLGGLLVVIYAGYIGYSLIS